jgi:hypothetical protein
MALHIVATDHRVTTRYLPNEETEHCQRKMVESFYFDIVHEVTLHSRFLQYK